MYDRKIEGKLLDFEASGALYHNALVLQDDQTLSFWAVISSKAIGGVQQGTQLVELPISQKTTWRDWLQKHPQTLLLSVDGQVHVASNSYHNYATSDKTFGPWDHPDKRLPPKTPIFTFIIDGQPFAITHETAESGWQGEVEGPAVFIHRNKGDSVYRSTTAYQGIDQNGAPVSLQRKGKQWFTESLGRFQPENGSFEKHGTHLKVLQGIDTFWYTWIPYYPKTVLLEPQKGFEK